MSAIDANEGYATPEPASGTQSVYPGMSAAQALPDFANFEIEANVLGAILLEPSCFNRVVVILGCTADDSQNTPAKKKSVDSAQSSTSFHLTAATMFRDPKHATIYEAMLNLQSKEISLELLMVTDYLEKNHQLEVIGGLPKLLELQNRVTSTAYLEDWCAKLRDYAMLREMIKTCNKALDLCRNNKEDIKTLLDTVESEIFKVRNNFVQPEMQDWKQLLTDTFQHLLDIINKKTIPGISTGYPDLDRLTGGGLKPGEMFVLAARPSIGKTAMALNIVRNIIMKDVPGVPRASVAFFSLEMSSRQVAERLLCTESQVPLSTIVGGDFKNSEMTCLTHAVAELKKAKLQIDPTAGISIFELRAKARKMCEQSKIDLVVIDYLQLMKGDAGGDSSRQAEVASISGGLKKLAKDLNIPVLVLAQLNRETEQAGKSLLPKLSNLRESGAIEQDADVVVFLHRNRDEAKENNGQPVPSVKAQLIVEKNRNGKTGIVELQFIPHLMEFRSVEHRFNTEDAQNS